MRGGQTLATWIGLSRRDGGIERYATAENVTQMALALTTIFRQHSQTYPHDYAAAWQVLDVDMSGLPCGPKAAFATKGYFAKQRNRRGRQLGRVLATRYGLGAIDMVHREEWGRMAALRGNKIISIPLAEAIASNRKVDKEILDAAIGILDKLDYKVSKTS